MMYTFFKSTVSILFFSADRQTGGCSGSSGHSGGGYGQKVVFQIS